MAEKEQLKEIVTVNLILNVVLSFQNMLNANWNVVAGKMMGGDAHLGLTTSTTD